MKYYLGIVEGIYECNEASGFGLLECSEQRDVSQNYSVKLFAQGQIVSSSQRLNQILLFLSLNVVTREQKTINNHIVAKQALRSF